MHDEHGPRGSLGDRLERSRDRLRLAGRARLREPLPDEDEQRQRDADANERGRAGDGDRHDAIVAANPSQVVHDSVRRVRKPR